MKPFNNLLSGNMRFLAREGGTLLTIIVHLLIAVVALHPAVLLSLAERGAEAGFVLFFQGLPTAVVLWLWVYKSQLPAKVEVVEELQQEIEEMKVIQFANSKRINTLVKENFDHHGKAAVLHNILYDLSIPYGDWKNAKDLKINHLMFCVEAEKAIKKWEKTLETSE